MQLTLCNKSKSRPSSKHRLANSIFGVIIFIIIGGDPARSRLIRGWKTISCPPTSPKIAHRKRNPTPRASARRMDFLRGKIKNRSGGLRASSRGSSGRSGVRCGRAGCTRNRMHRPPALPAVSRPSGDVCQPLEGPTAGARLVWHRKLAHLLRYCKSRPRQMFTCLSTWNNCIPERINPSTPFIRSMRDTALFLPGIMQMWRDPAKKYVNRGAFLSRALSIIPKSHIRGVRKGCGRTFEGRKPHTHSGWWFRPQGRKKYIVLIFFPTPEQQVAGCWVRDCFVFILRSDAL